MCFTRNLPPSLYLFFCTLALLPPEILWNPERETGVPLEQVCFYIRPEADFTSLEDLVARIHQDAAVTKAALEHPTLAAHSNDTSLHSPTDAPSPCDPVTTDDSTRS